MLRALSPHNIYSEKHCQGLTYKYSSVAPQRAHYIGSPGTPRPAYDSVSKLFWRCSWRKSRITTTTGDAKRANQRPRCGNQSDHQLPNRTSSLCKYLFYHTKTMTNLPVLVMIISVPRSWNLSHNSLVSSWQSTDNNSSQLQEVVGGNGRTGDGVSRSPSSVTNCIV